MQTAIAAIFVFLLVILLHELGHFTVAKLSGIKVNEFAIGMGPKLIQTKKGETLYTLRLLPIGGYVKMEGEDEKSNDPRSFNNVSTLKKIATVAAGALMNFILAIIVLSVVSFYTGMPTTTIDEVIKDSPAGLSGVLEGDKIISIDGIKTSTWNELSDTISKSDSSKEMDVLLIRNGEEKSIKIQPSEDNGRTIIGIMPAYEKSLGSAIKGGIETTMMFLGLMFDFLKGVFRGSVSSNDLSGPVGVITEIGRAAESGFLNLLNLLGFISVNLGFFNLLPIPALDGSRIAFLLVELVRGKPIDPDKEGFIHTIGFLLLITLMLFVTYKDLLRINLF